MTASLTLPRYGEYSRTDLILEVARLGLAVEDASHHQGPADEARTRAEFHHAMVALLALVEVEHMGEDQPVTQARLSARRQLHEELVARYQAELAQIEGQGV